MTTIYMLKALFKCQISYVLNSVLELNVCKCDVRINSAFVSYMASMDNTLLDLHNSSKDTPPSSLIVK